LPFLLFIIGKSHPNLSKAEFLILGTFCKIPNTKLQVPNKSQWPNPKPEIDNCIFDIWDLESIWNLGIVICSLFTHFLGKFIQANATGCDS